MDRRTFLKGAALGTGLAALRGSGASAKLLDGSLPAALSSPTSKSPVEHLVVVMMENRSVDHYLGWYGSENPAFDAHQTASFVDLRVGAAGPMVTTENWGQAGRGNFHGRGYEDPSHGWAGGRLERNGGQCNGWLDPDTGNDEFCLSYYDADDVPVWSQLVRNYQAYDRWHCSLLGPTQPNRYYLHSGQSGGFKSNTLPPQVASQHPEWTFGWDWPTIWTQLDKYGVSGSYYYCNLPQLAFWGPRHVNHMHHISEFYAAAAAGQLPQVSFIDPWYTAPEGLANDDHPFADIRLGQAFLSDIVEAFTSSPNYRNGALVLTYDEWGGFFEHVDPPRLPDDRGTPGDPGGTEDFGQLGFRIPSTIVSPWTKRAGAVDHTLYEHTSILRFISDNWGFGTDYLTTRVANTNSIANAFRFDLAADYEPAFTPYSAPTEVMLEPTTESLANGRAPHVLPVDAPGPAATSDLHRLAATGFMDNLGFRTDWKFEDSYMHSRPALLQAVQEALVH